MHKDAVADDVTVLVVDLLEVVDVERGEGDRPAVRPAWAKLARGVLIEPAPVEQAGERVGPRLAAQALEQTARSGARERAATTAIAEIETITSTQRPG